MKLDELDARLGFADPAPLRQLDRHPQVHPRRPAAVVQLFSIFVVNPSAPYRDRYSSWAD